MERSTRAISCSIHREGSDYPIALEIRLLWHERPSSQIAGRQYTGLEAVERSAVRSTSSGKIGRSGRPASLTGSRKKPTVEWHQVARLVRFSVQELVRIRGGEQSQLRSLKAQVLHCPLPDFGQESPQLKLLLFCQDCQNVFG